MPITKKPYQKKEELFDDEYKPNEAYDRVVEAYKNYQNVKKLSDQAYDNMINRKGFSYNVNNDAMYDKLVQEYADNASRAAEDAMGRAAALTGGYGSSYAQQVGQQTYQDYIGGVTDEADKLYDRALDRYVMEGQAMENKYNLLANKANTKYAEYAAAAAAANTDSGEKPLYNPSTDLTKYEEKMPTFNSQQEAAEFLNQLVENNVISDDDADWLMLMYADQLKDDPFYEYHKYIEK